MNARALSPEKLAQVLADYKAGMPNKEIAAKHSIGQSTARSAAARAGLPPRCEKISPHTRELIVASYVLLGARIQDIGAEYGCHPHHVKAIVAKAGYPLRRSGYHRAPGDKEIGSRRQRQLRAAHRISQLSRSHPTLGVHR